MISVGEAWGIARTEPARALVLLYAALRGSITRAEDALPSFVEHPERVAVMLRGLQGAPIVAPSPGEDLLLLRALDRHLRSERDAGWTFEPVEGHWLIQRGAPRVPGGSNLLDHLLSHVPHHHVIPREILGIQVDVRFANDHVGPTWTVLAAGFSDGVVLHGSPPARFRATGLSDPGRRRASARALLTEPAGVVVFPELTVPAADEALLRDDLGATELAVLGSFHEERGDTWTNTASLIDRRGDVVCRHDKLSRFHPKGVYEHITTGRHVTAVLTPHGLVLVGICKDFLAMKLRELWHLIAPDLVLVPSMGDPKTVRAQRRAAKDLHVVCGGRVVLASQAGHGAPDWVSGGAVLPAGGDTLAENDVRTVLRDRLPEVG